MAPWIGVLLCLAMALIMLLPTGTSARSPGGETVVSFTSMVAQNASFNPIAVTALDGAVQSSHSLSYDFSGGWNLIGTLYQQPMPWASVSVREGAESKSQEEAMAGGWIKGPFYGWTGTSYVTIAAGGSFQPTSGYWVLARKAGVRWVFSRP